MAARSGKGLALSMTDTGRHAGRAEDVDDWLYVERPPYEAKHAAGQEAQR